SRRDACLRTRPHRRESEGLTCTHRRPLKWEAPASSDGRRSAMGMGIPGFTNAAANANTQNTFENDRLQNQGLGDAQHAAMTSINMQNKKQQATTLVSLNNTLNKLIKKGVDNLSQLV